MRFKKVSDSSFPRTTYAPLATRAIQMSLSALTFLRDQDVGECCLPLLCKELGPQRAAAGRRTWDALVARLQGRAVDVVLSDMAPNLSGVAVSDAARIADLVELAIEFARQHLKADGALVAKVFHGSGYSQLVERFKESFRVVRAIKPKASRDKSAETFLVGRGLRPPR